MQRTRLLFPFVTASLVVCLSATPRLAAGEEAGHCNNKVCGTLETDTCLEQTNGPDTHCIESAVCAWDVC